MMFEVLHAALAGMPGRPLKLMRQLEFAAEQQEIDGFEPEALLDHLQNCTPTDDALSALRRRLALWDNADGDWTRATPRNSEDRRAVVYEALGLDEEWIGLCAGKLPFHPLEEATVISLKNPPWYTPEVRAARSFYWDSYARQLAANGWSEDAVRQLDGNTNRIVEKLADPRAEAAYQSKGLVVGYVQSGNPMHLQMEFLEGSAGKPGIDRWLVVSPEIANAPGAIKVEGAELNVVYRSRKPAGGARFNTYNDKRHRAFAEHLAGIKPLTDPSETLKPLVGPKTGVMLLYPITETKGAPKREELTVGFTLLFPKNTIRNAVGFTVHIPGPIEAVIDRDAGSGARNEEANS